MRAEYIVPLVTALDAQGGPDERGIRESLRFVIEGGMDGVAVLGSIGEFFAVSPRDKRRVIDIAADEIGGRVPMLAGVGGMDISESIDLANYAFKRGAYAALAISPYYFRLSERDILAYYDRLAASVNGPVYLYNFPERTGYDLGCEITLKLLRRHKNILGYKDTLPGMDHPRALIEAVRAEFPEFKIYSGFDENFAHNALSGGAGCIAGLGNVLPERLRDWARAVNANDAAGIAAGQRTVNRMMALYAAAPLFTPAIKCAMALRGVPVGPACTFPIQSCDASERDKIARLLASCGLI